jgi:hypothetical protein
MWPFKRRKKYRLITKVIDLPLPILIRQVVYDSIFNDAEKISNLMGLPPISEEVHDMEVRASEERLDKFDALMPFIDAHADIAARVSASAYILTNDELGEFADPDNFEELTRLFKLISISASVSCLSTFIELGLIETKVVSNDE